MCLAATLIGIRVVVGSWKGLVLLIQIRKPQEYYNKYRAKYRENHTNIVQESIMYIAAFQSQL